MPAFSAQVGHVRGSGTSHHSLLAISSPRLPTLSLKLLSFPDTLAAVPPRGADDGTSAVPMMERPKKEIDFESGADVSGTGLRAAISACRGRVRVSEKLVGELERGIEVRLGL